MAKKNKDDDTGNKVLWIGGTAMVTAFAMYYVNRYLNEKEELTRLKYAEQQQLKEGGSE